MNIHFCIQLKEKKITVQPQVQTKKIHTEILERQTH